MKWGHPLRGAGAVHFQWYSFQKSVISAYSERLDDLAYSAQPTTISFFLAAFASLRLRGFT
jgi:hypothetical protein